MKKKLIEALSFLPDGQGIDFGDDTFLTGLFDGSDKIYGIGRDKDVYNVISRGGEYPINDMEDGDIEYIFANIFKDRPYSIYEKIKSACYRIEDTENI